MSFPRPATFPLLKLPFLCIEAVVKSFDIFDIICFALISKRTRRIVKLLNIHLNIFEISVSKTTWIWLRSYKLWYFKNTNLKSLFYQNSNSIPLYTSREDDHLVSYTDGNEITALKMAMEFLNDVFKCSVEHVTIENRSFPESLGVKSTESLNIRFNNSQPFSKAQNLQLNLLLENLEVTGTCKLLLSNTEGGFYVDPKLFKCRKLMFGTRSAAWVTEEILMQFEVPQLHFYGYHQCSVEDILSFVTNWFHSDNKKLEYLFFLTENEQFSLENFQTEELNLVPFRERTRVPLIYKTEIFARIDYSVGLEIVRKDGLEASIYVNRGVFLFNIWHNQ